MSTTPSSDDDIEAALARINANLAASASSLRYIGPDLFEIARTYSLTFEEIAQRFLDSQP